MKISQSLQYHQCFWFANELLIQWHSFILFFSTSNWMDSLLYRYESLPYKLNNKINISIMVSSNYLPFRWWRAHVDPTKIYKLKSDTLNCFAIYYAVPKWYSVRSPFTTHLSIPITLSYVILLHEHYTLTFLLLEFRDCRTNASNTVLIKLHSYSQVSSFMVPLNAGCSSHPLNFRPFCPCTECLKVPPCIWWADWQNMQNQMRSWQHMYWPSL